MKEKAFITVYYKGDWLFDQDVTGFSITQVADNMAIKESHGLDCCLKRVFIPEKGKGRCNYESTEYDKRKR